MKHQNVLILLSILLTFACLFSSCNADKSILPDADETQSTNEYDLNIQALENQILALQQNQQLSELERQKELEHLQSLLAQLKEETTKEPDDSTSNNSDNSATPSGKFLYNLEGEDAIITGYTGTEEQMVIPAMIDGYAVREIADNAFSSKQLKSVIITNGITKIGWFSFQNCPSLASVTIPNSIESIGYSAFPSQNKNFTVYCQSNSFAQQYAKSYGIPHATV
ncbi:MAG: leucine-rich repeat protein [Clostridia bacterium]|nr:leucine-rich repeat protein [Clostridia bacterium]